RPPAASGTSRLSDGFKSLPPAPPAPPLPIRPALPPSPPAVAGVLLPASAYWASTPFPPLPPSPKSKPALPPRPPLAPSPPLPHTPAVAPQQAGIAAVAGCGPGLTAGVGIEAISDQPTSRADDRLRFRHLQGRRVQGGRTGWPDNAAADTRRRHAQTWPVQLE